jgi:hypothetical protein
VIFVSAPSDKFDIWVCFIFVRISAKWIIHVYWNIREYYQISIYDIFLLKKINY